MLECVVNVSEGRRAEVLDRLAAAAGRTLLDVHRDPDHHRSVFTLAGPRTEVEAAAFRLAEAAWASLDLAGHEGAHPRLGTVDVVPFVALEGDEPEAAVAAAWSFARRAATGLAVPVFLYGDADPQDRSLPEVRRDAFGARSPDFGPATPHPRWGAVAVGARPVLVAVNCQLESPDVALARRIARQVRERNGGLPGVRALGFLLASRGRAQVSMNLADVTATGVEVACSEVRRLARELGSDVAAVELVGLVPAAELARWSRGFRRWSGIGDEHTIEGRLRRVVETNTGSTPSRWEPESRLGAG